MSRLAEYQKNAKERFDNVQAMFKTIDTEQGGEPKPEQVEQIKTWNKEAEEFLTSAKQAEDWDAQRDAAKKGLDYLGQPVSRFQYGNGRGEDIHHLVPAAVNMAEGFVKSAMWQDYLKTYAPDGRFPERMRINTNPVNFNQGVKALITGSSDTSAGALFRNDRKPILDPGVTFRPLKVRDLVNVGTTTGDTVEYVRMDTRTNAAATVAEATATGGSSGVKPEGNAALVVITEPVKTIAEWIAVTRRALADAGQIRTMLEQLLRYDVGEKLDSQMISGDGVGENFTGILNVSGTQTQTFDTDMLTTLRKARTKVNLVGRATPTGYVLHPNDLEELDLLTDNEERYYFGGPVVGGVPRLWGLPVVETEAMTENKAVVGQWDLAMLWDREQANILASDSHADFFIRNLIALLCELRAAFGVIRPKAFVEADLV
jgi:HK97 family phage major capsid protein